MLAATLAACGRSSRDAPPRAPTLASPTPGAFEDPTVRPSRLVPRRVPLSAAVGHEAGSARVLMGTLRVLATPGGSVEIAAARLPSPPVTSEALPARLGGGYLFVIGSSVWRAARWLSEPRPIYAHSAAITELAVGLDRVYARSSNGATAAFDPVTGDTTDLGPWPRFPTVSAYAALDGWHAAALTDIGGVVMTANAGASYHAIAVPSAPTRLYRVDNNVYIASKPPAGPELSYQLTLDGQLHPAQPRAASPSPQASSARAPASSAPPSLAAARGDGAASAERRDGAAAHAATASPRHPFGERPLEAAIEDGWPLSDGTALVARDGELARVRLSDGAIVEHVRRAFDLDVARCHGVSLTRPSARGAFGFVCGEPNGRTDIYAYAPLKGRLALLRRFAEPRVVTSSGNGALVVRGPCDSATPASDGAHAYCILGLDDRVRDVTLRGSLGGERVVALADGRVAVLSPDDIGPNARLTLIDAGRATTKPVRFKAPPSSAREARALGRTLTYGLWLEGFEERRPGVLGGWIEGGGHVLGVEVTLDGAASPGELLRESIAPFVGGRYGFGWTASRRAFETTDGGMSWQPVDLPDVIGQPDASGARACGAIGCLAGAWLRVGWGPSPAPALADSAPKPAPFVAPRAPATLSLSCAPIGGAVRVPEARAARAPMVSPQGGGLASAVWGSSSTVLSGPTLTSFLPFHASPPPAMAADEAGVSFEAATSLDERPRNGSLARLYAWGPKSGDWAGSSRALVRFLSPFAGWPHVRSTMEVMPQGPLLDLVSAPQSRYGSAPAWSLVAGDDERHALAVANRRGGATPTLLLLEADRPPVVVRRADGGSFSQIDAAVRVGSRWVVATPPASAAPPWTAAIWVIEGDVARELTTIPRHGLARRPTGAHLARRDSATVGYVVEGEPAIDHHAPHSWVVPVDLESGAASAPEDLGPNDFSGMRASLCTSSQGGWVVDVPWIGAIAATLGGRTANLRSVFARVHLDGDSVCFEGASTTFDRPRDEGAAELAGARRPLKPGEVLITTDAGAIRYPMACRDRRAP